MFTVKSKNTFLDIWVGSIYSQTIFPTNLIWIIAYGLHVRDVAVPLISSGQYYEFLTVSLVWILDLVVIMLVVSFMLVGFGAFSGKFKSHFAGHEYTFDGTTLVSKNANWEQKEDIKNINKVVETKKCFYLFKGGFSFSILSKAQFTPEETVQVSEFFKSKKSNFLKYWFTAMPYLVIVLVIFVGWQLLKPAYKQELIFNPMSAFWKDDELVIAIPEVSLGTEYRMIQNYFPSLFRLPEGETISPHYDLLFFDIKNGKLVRLLLNGEGPMSVFIFQTDVYCRMDQRGKTTFSKFNGSQFVPLAAQEAAVFEGTLNRDETSDSIWSRFSLWDENNEEIFDMDKNQDFWGTVPLKTGILKIHLESNFKDKGHIFQTETYTLTGLGAAPVSLAQMTNEPQEIDEAQFEKLFPIHALPKKGAIHEN